MGITWFVVMSQSQMKIFTRKGKSKALTHLETLHNPLVNLKGAALVRHKPGVRAKGGKGTGRNIMDSGVVPHDQIVADFARHMAEFLGASRKKDKFDDLCLSAEPKFMGLVKKSLDRTTAKTVRAWIGKDLEKATAKKLEAAFAEVPWLSA